ncbi:MAG: YcaO-like family protein [Pseudomonadota bacterium]
MHTPAYCLPASATTLPRPLGLTEVHQGLVDPHFGLVKMLVESCSSPEFPQLHIAAAVLSNSAYFCENKPPPVNVPMGAAGAGVTREQCLWSTLGEAVERYCGGIYYRDMVYYADGRELDGLIFPLPDMILYSDEQYDNPSFPFYPIRKVAKCTWVEGRDLISGKPLHLPAQLVYFGFRANNQEALTQTVSTGLACGATALDAIVSGFREILERDVFISMWLLNYAPTRIEIDAGFAAQMSDGARSLLDNQNVDIKLWYLPNEFGAITVLACAEGRHGYRLGFGAACHFSLAQACEKAIVEACHTWTWSVRFAQETLERADEQLSTYGNSGDSKDHVSYYLAPEKRAQIAFLLDSPNSIGASALDAEIGTTSFNAVLQKIADSGRTVAWIDVTAADVAAVGLNVVKVIISTMQPLYFGNPDCFANQDRRRLAQLAAFWNVPVPPALNMAPHPFP